MKLNASRAVDTEDLILLWPLCAFESPEVAAEQFWEAYPSEDRDEHLAELIRSIIE